MTVYLFFVLNTPGSRGAVSPCRSGPPAAASPSDAAGGDADADAAASLLASKAAAALPPSLAPASPGCRCGPKGQTT